MGEKYCYNSKNSIISEIYSNIFEINSQILLLWRWKTWKIRHFILMAV